MNLTDREKTEIEIKQKMIEEYARSIATSLVLFGVDIRDKFESAVSMHECLERTYIKGKADAFKQAYERINQWTPCREGLPEENINVNITNCYGVVRTGYWFEEKGNKYWYCDRDVFVEDYAIAWQPLPKPYEG